MNDDRGARSPREFATWAGISLSSVYNEWNAGRLKFRKFGTRTLILDEDARAWLNSQPVHAPSVKEAA